MTRQFTQMVSPEEPLCRFLSQRDQVKSRIDSAFEILLRVSHEQTEADLTGDAGFILDVVRDVAMVLTGLDVVFQPPKDSGE